MKWFILVSEPQCSPNGVTTVNQYLIGPTIRQRMRGTLTLTLMDSFPMFRLCLQLFHEKWDLKITIWIGILFDNLPTASYSYSEGRITNTKGNAMTFFLFYRLPGGLPVVETFDDIDSAARAHAEIVVSYPGCTAILEDQNAEVFACQFCFAD